eukprot:scaffold15580_cov207-Cylindrotheca_fusiformis.AAC.1
MLWKAEDVICEPGGSDESSIAGGERTKQASEEDRILLSVSSNTFEERLHVAQVIGNRRAGGIVHAWFGRLCARHRNGGWRWSV